MCGPNGCQCAKKPESFTVFTHHIYEYQKGLRNLILHTTRAENEPYILERLRKHTIDYHIQHLPGGERINVFFGAQDCVAVVKGFAHKALNKFSPEEDFILGTMLGYARHLQVERYLKRITQEQKELPLQLLQH